MRWQFWRPKARCGECGFLCMTTEAIDGYAFEQTKLVDRWAGDLEREFPAPVCYMAAFDLTGEFHARLPGGMAAYRLADSRTENEQAMFNAWSAVVRRRRRCPDFTHYADGQRLDQHLARHDEFARHRDSVRLGVATAVISFFAALAAVSLGWLLANA